MVGRNNFTIGMLKTMYDYFFEVYDQKDTVYDKIFKEEPSDAAFEQSTTVVGMGKLLLKPENEPIIFRQPQEGYTTYGINNTFADGIEISMEAVDDHQRIDNLVRAAAQTWAEAVRWTKEKFYADTFNLGGKTAGDATFRNVIAGVLEQNADGLQYDGKPLINLSNNLRSSKGGGTYYNGLALPLTQPNLITAVQLMQATNNRNERDEIVSIVPDTLVVPPALQYTARVILNSTLLPGTVNNDINALAGMMKLVVWDYLSGSTSWFVMKAGSGIVAQNRKEPVIDFYEDQDTKSYKANIVTRFGRRVDNWRYLVGSNAATS